MRVSARLLLPILVFAVLSLAGCMFGPLLSDVSVAPEAISPNADGTTM